MPDLETPPWMQGWKPTPAPSGVVTTVGNPLWIKGGPSPNPSGRPRGITDKKAKLVQRMLDDAEGIVDAIIAKALEGDSNSASLILSRVLPSIKAQAEKVQFDFDADAPVSKQVEMVLAAIADGVVAPDVGRQIIDAISSLATVRAGEELEARILALEDASRG
jgi:hypothetical protein